MVSSQCFYFSCNVEVGLIFIGLFLFPFILFYLLPHIIALHYCKKGDHIMVWVDESVYHEYHNATYECACKAHRKIVTTTSSDNKGYFI